MNRTSLARILVLVIACSACSARGSGLEQLTADQLFERGITALNDGKWTQATEAFDRFILQFPTHPRAQEARFRLAESFFGKKEYISAATEFARLASDFPNGTWADDSRLKVCESYYRLSPRPVLDQQYTKAALDHCLAFEELYPNSEHVARAKELALEMMNRLAEKEFMVGDFYYRRRAFDSAIMYFERAARDYPEASIAPRSLLRLFESYTSLGYNDEAAATRERLLKDYPDSEAARTLRASTVARTS